MSSFGTQLRVLLEKNILIKKRRRKLTIIEILYPLYFAVLLFVLKATGGDVISFHTEPTPSYQPSTILPLSFMQYQYPIALAYSPNNIPLLNDITSTMGVNGLLKPDSIKGFASVDEMQAYYHEHPTDLWGGLNVRNITQTTAKYDIALNSSSVFGENNMYIYNGYISLQVSFLQTWLNKLGQTLRLNLTATQFPTPGTTYRQSLFAFLFPIYLPLMFMYSLQQLVVMMVTEKERKVREAFKIMGMKAIASYLSWFIVHSVINIVSIIIFVVVLVAAGVFKYSNILAIIIPFILFGCTITLIGFLVSVFASKPRLAASIGSLITLISAGLWFLIHFFVYDKGHNSNGLKFFFSLFSGIAFGEFSYNLSVDEFNQKGLTLSDPLFINTCTYLLVDIAIYGTLVWYFDNIYAGQYGVAKKWYFPFTKTYWRRSPSSNNIEDISINTPLLSTQGGGVEVTNLHKTYTDGNKNVKAVNGLSLSVNRGQILALLGHNGAGKSTTINILTGLFPPTSGHINIMGYDYELQMDIIRRIVGYCPQHNILLDELTCAEHLKIFGLLKGVSKFQIAEEINEKLEEVGLLDKKDTLTKELSGGMKRKLSVAIAFIGGSSLIFLDECTAGMDPYSRRKIWQLLQKYKSKKTIIMTTHFMEEAELLGDYIAIMAQGKLRCSGTSLQLKNQFGVGYILRCVKADESIHRSSEPLDLFVKSAFPEAASLPSPSGLELIYSIPNDMTHFGKFFAELQKRQNEFNIKSYGLSMTTLEEVFLKIAAEDHETELK